MYYYKYPRTPHFDFSKGINEDDIVKSESFQEGEPVVVTEKMDGENTTIYPDGYCHARSIDSARSHHPSRSWIKAFAAQKSYMIPKDLRICGENVYAVHSITYTELESYFLLFSLWKDDVCLDWTETISIAKDLGISTVPVLYEGPFSYNAIKEIYDSTDYEKQEGIVCRSLHQFTIEEFPSKVFKAVRPNHVQSDEHWMNKPVIPNKLKQ